MQRKKEQGENRRKHPRVCRLLKWANMITRCARLCNIADDLLKYWPERTEREYRLTPEQFAAIRTLRALHREAMRMDPFVDRRFAYAADYERYLSIRSRIMEQIKKAKQERTE